MQPPIIHRTVASILDALPRHPDATPLDHRNQRDAAMATLEALAPRSPLEALLGARMILAHEAAMDCFRRAAQPGLPNTWALRLHGKAIALSRLALDIQQALERRPASAQPADPTLWRQHPMPSEPSVAEASPPPPRAASPAPASTAHASTARASTARASTTRASTIIASPAPEPQAPAAPPQIQRQHPMPSEPPLSRQSAATVLHDIRGPNMGAWQAHLATLPPKDVVDLFATLVAIPATGQNLRTSVSRAALAMAS